VETEISSHRLVFETDEPFKFILHGDGDISKIEVQIDGNAFQSSPKFVEGGWIYDIGGFRDQYLDKTPEISISVHP